MLAGFTALACLYSPNAECTWCPSWVLSPIASTRTFTLLAVEPTLGDVTRAFYVFVGMLGSPLEWSCTSLSLRRTFNSAGSLFVWAFSLMFLFSGRGYWQELIESIIWAHKVVVAAHVLG